VVLGIALIALSVVAAVPIVLDWRASWPWAVLAIVMGGAGVTLIRRHMSRHRVATAGRQDQTT
jgi:hypothetical protein